ncbi:MAG: pyridoxal phosphate-dependent aminotransferase [Ruminococcaceae bacterium]|jgi:aspartate/methionine/tyrosine aminotransferase|nr:pyridoxal phosphate-dependent aminotransferase [Oscillospiraceae bacterium]
MIFQKEVGESLTYKFAQAAGEMRAQGKEIISLGLGEPDFKTPDYVVEATVKAMNDGFTHYSATQGWPELRKLISEDCNNQYGSDYSFNDVIVTPGIKSAVYFALASVLEPQDEIILISPYYVSYPAMVKLAEPTAKIVNVTLNKDFTLDSEKLKAAFNKNTKAILVNSPNNPTGMVLSSDEVKLINELAVENDAYIISDEVYEKLVYSNQEHISFGCFDDIRDRLIICNGFSKSHAMTGWRLGYAIGTHGIIAKMNKLQQHINTNTCTFVQVGACSIFKNKPSHLKGYVSELEKRIDYFDTEINKLDYISGVRPKAGFFYFVDISKTGVDSNTFCADLLKKTGIASTPGVAFGPEWDSYVRFSIAVPMSTLERAVDLLKNYRYGE